MMDPKNVFAIKNTLVDPDLIVGTSDKFGNNGFAYVCYINNNPFFCYN